MLRREMHGIVSVPTIDAIYCEPKSSRYLIAFDIFDKYSPTTSASLAMRKLPKTFHKAKAFSLFVCAERIPTHHRYTYIYAYSQEEKIIDTYICNMCA